MDLLILNNGDNLLNSVSSKNHLIGSYTNYLSAQIIAAPCICC